MPGWSNQARGVRWEPVFEQARQAVEPDTARFDELISAIEWQISMAPESCPQVPGTPFRLARARLPGRPSRLLRVLFTINDDKLCSVWGLDMSELPREEDPA